MEEASYFCLPQGIRVDQIQSTEKGRFIIEATAIVETACCPECGQTSSSIHCHYQRRLQDVPCAGHPVCLLLTVRKFSCRNPLCERKVFAERLPDLVKPFARMTLRFSQQITSIGLATCGKGGVRLAVRLGIRTSRQTILRRIMELPDPPAESILFLGIDDFAFRRGRSYGTILVNLETRHVVGLLPDRKAETAAGWIRNLPDVMAVSRDRGGDYAAAALLGAPQARQYADRFHLAKNLGEAVEAVLSRHLAVHRSQLTESFSPTPLANAGSKQPSQLSPKEAMVSQAKREERLARYEQVVALHKQGLSHQAIAARVGMGRTTITRWLAHDAFPEQQKRPRKTRLDPLWQLVAQRWEAGCHNIAELHRGLVADGYAITYKVVYKQLVRSLPQGRKHTQTPASLPRAPRLPRSAAFLFLRDPEKLRGEEQQTVLMLRQLHPDVELTYDLAHQFREMLQARAGHLLENWLTQVKGSRIRELLSFAKDVEKDKEAVRAGLTWWINNGMVEGHVNKLKLIKRQGYGQADFPLLRKRVLHAI